jgi:hypothetical protein
MPASSEKQRRLFGMVYACKKKKGKKCPKRIKKIAKGISLKAARDFAVKENLEFDQTITFKQFLRVIDNE